MQVFQETDFATAYLTELNNIGIPNQGFGTVSFSLLDQEIRIDYVTISTTNTGTVVVENGEATTTLNNDGTATADINMGGTGFITSEDGTITVNSRRDILLGLVDADSDGDNTRGDVNMLAGEQLVPGSPGCRPRTPHLQVSSFHAQPFRGQVQPRRRSPGLRRRRRRREKPDSRGILGSSTLGGRSGLRYGPLIGARASAPSASMAGSSSPSTLETMCMTWL